MTSAKVGGSADLLFRKSFAAQLANFSLSGSFIPRSLPQMAAASHTSPAPVCLSGLTTWVFAVENLDPSL